MENISSVLLALIGTAITFLGTLTGSAFVFFTKKEKTEKMQKLFLGFAAGVMIAASVWSLIIPAAAYSAAQGMKEWLPCGIGFVFGGLFLYFIDKIFPYDKLSNGSFLCAEASDKFKRTSKLIFAVTLHNFPEGMAVGLTFALAGTGSMSITVASAFAFAIGIAIQNLPEGAVISLPLCGSGITKKRAFVCGMLSGVVEPVAGVLGALIAMITFLVIPWMLAFAAGAMIYVVVDEIIPDVQNNRKGGLGTLGAVAGFTLMMVLDIALG